MRADYSPLDLRKTPETNEKLEQRYALTSGMSSISRRSRILNPGRPITAPPSSFAAPVSTPSKAFHSRLEGLARDGKLTRTLVGGGEGNGRGVEI